MVPVVQTILIVLYCAATLALLAYSLTCLVYALLYRRARARLDARPAPPPARLPRVTTQLALFNERAVVERLLAAVTSMDYPRELHDIQVLDDSTDDTSALVAALVREYRRRGFSIEHVHRAHRRGYKAGALDAGLARARGEVIALFDADFVPPRDFLSRLVPRLLAAPDIAAVQARWDHLNPTESALTRVQRLSIDVHFMMEQTVRAGCGLFMNFNGSAAVWRRRAIEDAGGWQADTLTEDLDLSLRAELAGWRLSFAPDVRCPQELTTELAAFKTQQQRWAQGDMQTLRKLGGRILRSRRSLAARAEALFHLSRYAIHPLIALTTLLSLPLLLLVDLRMPWQGWAAVGAVFLAGSFAPNVLYACALRALDDKPWSRWMEIPLLNVVGIGLGVSNTRAVIRGLLGRQTEFIRTPKRGDGLRRGYGPRADPWVFAELGLGFYALIAAVVGLSKGHLVLGPFLLLYAAGFLTVGVVTLAQARGGKREDARGKNVPEPALPGLALSGD